MSTANQALAGTQCHKEQRGEGSSQQWSVACTQQGGMQWPVDMWRVRGWPVSHQCHCAVQCRVQWHLGSLHFIRWSTTQWSAIITTPNNSEIPFQLFKGLNISSSSLWMKTLNYLHLNFLSFWPSQIEENKMPHSLHPSIPRAARTSVSNTAVCGCGVRGGTLVTGVPGPGSAALVTSTSTNVSSGVGNSDFISIFV